MKAEKNKVVSLHYTLTDDGGVTLDSSRGREPLSYLHGYGNIIRGLEAALEGSGGFTPLFRLRPPTAMANAIPRPSLKSLATSFLPARTFRSGCKCRARAPMA